MLTLYTHPFSTPALSTLFTAYAAKAEFENVVVDVTKSKQREPDYLAINPIGKVPALKDGDFRLSESGAIMRYLARKTDSTLLPTDPQALAIVDQWMDFIAHHVRTPFSHVQFGRMFAKLFGQEPNEAAIQNGINQLQGYLPHVDARLEQHQYICGDYITIADIALIAALDPADAIKLDLSQFKALSAFLKRERQSDWYTAVHKHYGEEMGL